jgi:hypothetical protein
MNRPLSLLTLHSKIFATAFLGLSLLSSLAYSGANPARKPTSSIPASTPTPSANVTTLATNASTMQTQDVDTATAVSDAISERSLVPLITDIPSTFTFRASCIKKTYVDGFYKKQLNAPKLVRNGNGVYTLYATCLNGLGVPVDTKIKLKLIIRHIGDIRTISIRSIVDHTKRYRNCADISNRNGILACIPPAKPAAQ